MVKETACYWKTPLTFGNSYVKLLKLIKGSSVWPVNYDFEITNLDSIKMNGKNP